MLIKNKEVFVADINPLGQHTVVFLHGWPLSHKIFEYQFDFLPKHGIRCIGIDLLGFGGSDAPWQGYDYDSMAAMLGEIVKSMGLDNFSLLGYSMGGGIAAKFAARYGKGQVERLMLLAAACPVFVQRPDYPFGMTTEQADAFAHSFANDKPKALAEFAKNVFDGQVSPQLFDWFCGIAVGAGLWSAHKALESLMAEDLRSDLKLINMPTAVFHGVKDKICPFELAQETHKEIRGSFLLPFEDSGHGIFFEEKEKLNRAILNFVRGGIAASSGLFDRNAHRRRQTENDLQAHVKLGGEQNILNNFAQSDNKNSVLQITEKSIKDIQNATIAKPQSNLGFNNITAADSNKTAFEVDSALNQHYKFSNKPLPFDFDALEPFIDSKTMELHHDRHLQKYIDDLNNVLASYPQLHSWRLERLIQMADTLPAAIRRSVLNSAGGIYNHFFYFDSLTDNPAAKVVPPEIAALIDSAFGTVDNFKAELKTKAMSVFGSGYAWLVVNKSGHAEIMPTANQDTPLSSRRYPLLNIDVWEHAYYLKHYNSRAAYIDDWFEVINWTAVGLRLKNLKNPQQ